MKKGEKMRNIVLITFDSLRADHCGFMGYERETTPNIDRMAKNGLYFENAIASAVGTPASLTGIFTGDYAATNPKETSPEPWRKEIYGRQTLAQILSKKGYSTGAFNPNAFVSSYFGFDKGFDYFQDFLSDEVDNGVLSRLHKRLLEKVAREGREGLPWALRNLRNFVQREEVFKPWESYYDQIVEWAERAEKPFFIWILSLDTHYPYLAPGKYRKWGTLFDMYYYNWKIMKVGWEAKFSEKESQKFMNAYDDAIRYADSFIERLWNDLKNYDPIFVIHADHGEAFGEHGFYGHPPELYEEVLHVPLVMYNTDTGVKGGIDKPVSLHGIGPTILELIGEKNEFASSGFLKGEREWALSKMIFEGNKMTTAVRMKRWKYIEGQKEGGELFDLEKDPLERENLIDVHPDFTAEMKKIAEGYVKHDEEKKRIREKIWKSCVEKR